MNNLKTFTKPSMIDAARKNKPFSLQDSYEECRQLNAHYGTPFYHAINSFPKKHQPHIHAICAYARIIHRIVHHPNEGVSKTKQRQAVRKYVKELEAGLKDSHSDDIYLQAIVHTAKFKEIPTKHFKNFASQMLKDLDVKEYDNFKALQSHLDKTAGELGKMLAHILDFSDEKALDHAARLLRAGQTIEMICDTGKEYDLKKRVYLAQTDLKKFGYPVKNLGKQKITGKWKKLLEHYLIKAEKDIAFAEKGLKHFSSDVHKALNVTSQIYLGFIESIRKSEYDIFKRRPDVSWAHRIKCALPF